MTLRVVTQDGHFTATLKADAAYMLPEFRGDADGAAPDLAWLRNSGEKNWKRIQSESRAYLNQCLKFSVPTTLEFPDFQLQPPRFMVEGIAEALPLIDVEFHGTLPASNRLELTWSEPFGVVLIVEIDQRVIPMVSGETIQVLQQDSRTSRFLRWVQLGFVHIIPRGLDHILFILGIFFLIPEWRPLLRLSILFTLAHSVTLGFAVAGFVDLPTRPVELIIAGSIVWIGIENLRPTKTSYLRYGLVTIFGLIHGLGFAKMLVPHIPTDRWSFFEALIGFNFGVELGQLAVLVAAYLLLRPLPAHWFRRIRVVGSLMISVAGLIWLATR